ncbi:MAG: hypothetical protein V4465_03290 [Patescibacteria group bacterium]
MDILLVFVQYLGFDGLTFAEQVAAYYFGEEDLTAPRISAKTQSQRVAHEESREPAIRIPDPLLLALPQFRDSRDLAGMSVLVTGCGFTRQHDPNSMGCVCGWIGQVVTIAGQKEWCSDLYYAECGQIRKILHTNEFFLIQ